MGIHRKVSARKLRTCIDDPGRFSCSLFADARLCLAFFFAQIGSPEQYVPVEEGSL